MVTGLSMSAGLIVMIIGIPFFLLFVGFTRVLALAEGRLVEGLLGQRMPRRPVYPAKGVPIFERIKRMLVDRRTWTTMFYFLLMLPLGILYFVIAIVGICVSMGLVGGAVAAVLMAFGVGGGSVTWDDPVVYYGPSPLAAPFLLIGGVLLLTAVLHLIRAIGRGHGTLAKNLLVARIGRGGLRLARVFAALLLPLLMSQADASPATPPALRCLPGEDGFITMRLRGSIEQEVHWTEPALECTGMSRPDGKGLRVRFAGAIAGGELAVVFAAPELAVGRSARSVPVNVTLLDGSGERIYGTQGDGRCELRRRGATADRRRFVAADRASASARAASAWPRRARWTAKVRCCSRASISPGA